METMETSMVANRCANVALFKRFPLPEEIEPTILLRARVLS
jgi:hypothetical protein